MNYPLHIIDNSNTLKYAVRYIFEKNTSNYLPYHNLNHLLQVMKFCHILITKNDKVFENDEKITILLAALFHDFKYDTTLKNDKLKIELSKNGFLEFYDRFKNNFDEDIKITEVFKIIDATEYPYVIPSGDLTYKQMILRDADLMQLFETNFLHQNIFGLAKELNIPIENMIKNQRNFINNISFNTEFAREYQRLHSDYIEREIRTLEKLYE